MSEIVITAQGLTKRYGKRTVVDAIDLMVSEGEVLGLLGPNGAGKTTTILMLLGLTEPSAGTVSILGKDPLREPLTVKREVGYLPDAVGFYDNLSARENLRYTARLGGMASAALDAAIDEALAQVRLGDVADRRVATYSRGMRQRLGLAELLMRKCRVAILDEPTSGLDPQSTHELLEMIAGFAKGGMTVLLSSHLLDVVQTICSRVALFNNGRIGFVGTIDELTMRVAEGGLHIDLAADKIDVPAVVGSITGVTSVTAAPDGHWLVAANSDVRPEIASRVVGKGGSLRSLDAHRIGLGEAYTRFFEGEAIVTKREGSPLRGVQTVAIKEAADHIGSARLHLIMLLVLLVSAGALYAAIGQIKQTTAQDPYLFLKLMTVAQQPLPSFASLLGFLLPLVGIGLGFDAINGEFSRRTLSRILAQPIYRDALLFGKLLGGLFVIAVALLTLWLLTTGAGILLLGQPPSGEDVARGLIYLLATLVYSGVWLAVAIAFSTVLRSPATSALAALALWLVLSVFWSMLAPLAAQAIAPINPLDPVTALHQYEWLQGISRLSPANLYSEIAAILLDPSSRSVGPVFMSQMQGALIGAPLSTMQSILIVWPQIASLFAAMVLLFTLAYILFQRQEVRA